MRVGGEKERGEGEEGEEGGDVVSKGRVSHY